MKSQLLEATVIINEKRYIIINTAMEIFIEWKIDLIQGKDFYKINFDVQRVNGKFSYDVPNLNYQKTITIKFNTDSDWKFSITNMEIKYPELSLQPYSAEINLDNKITRLTF
jgi:hypothetical protein